jgi:F0F1-type ATP synthase assembly protein I
MKATQFLPGVDRQDKSTQLTADLLASILTWGGVGWLLDRLLGTAPVLMAIGIMAGNACGIYLLYLRTREDDQPTAAPATVVAPVTPADD